ncbi:MAG: DUF4337 domain-containing protein [Gemmatimonadota bacterium]|nr:DUF4337 domain-containing protein [Gemmatimonadota bacterium]
MPEEIEIDTDKLRESIDREIERQGGSLLRWISLTTALLAALAAIGSLRAGATVNEALVLKTEATRLQAEASDQWAYYQAKGIKAAVAQSALNTWLAIGKAAPPALAQQSARYTAEQGDIQHKATELEARRDERSREADRLLEKHHHYATAVALFQIAIALGAIAALTRVRLAWLASLVAGVIGIAMLAMPYFQRS